MKNEGAVSGNPGSSGISAGFSIVVAMDRNRGIGKDGGLPWPKLKGDMKFFRELTTCPDSAAVEKRWGLKPEESAETKTWDEVSAMLKFAHKLPEASGGKWNVVAMGRKTWDSLPNEFKPLPGRINYGFSRRYLIGNRAYIGTNHPLAYDQVEMNHSNAWREGGDHSIEEVLLGLKDDDTIGRIYVIGGGEFYRSTMQHPACAHLYITEIDAEFPCDTFFPETPGFQPVLSSPWIEENGIRYRFRRYDRIS
jgi:dihydrofolate reductase